MKKMVCPITGATLFVADERVDKYKKAGYKLATAKKGAKKAEPEPEQVEEPAEPEQVENAE